MEWILISLIVGLVLGLTGSGGGLVAIPLFIQVMKMDVKQATAISLVTVFLGALLNWRTQRHNTQTKISVLLFGTSILGSAFSSFLKPFVPSVVIAAMIVVLSLYSLLQFWRGKNKSASENSEIPSEEIRVSWITTWVAGFGLGVLTTLTGLGGGVVLVPLLLRVFGLYLHQAIATSLLTIALTSLGSLMFQSGVVFETVDLISFFLLVVGVFLSGLILPAVLKKFSEQKILMARRVVFTVVIFWAIVSVISKTLFS